MKAIIIEDEKLSADHLERLLKRIDESIEVIAKFDTVKGSIESLNKGITADIIFMDIHLADGISFDIFPKLSHDIPVVFTTAYDEYAIKAFKYNSIDYLLKPIGVTELKSAIEKFKKVNPVKDSVSLKDMSHVYEAIQKQHKSRFLVKMGDGIVSVKAEEVCYFLSEDGVVLLVTQNSKRYALDYTLDELENLIDNSKFFRINRKVIVSINSIQKISNHFNSRLKLALPALGDDESIVSRDRVNDFKAWLDA
jgi:DNA-binding LytR/AlgR family response regulator